MGRPKIFLGKDKKPHGGELKTGVSPEFHRQDFKHEKYKEIKIKIVAKTK